MPDKDRFVREFWAGQPQRTMRLLNFGLSTVKEQDQQSDPIWRRIVEILSRATARDETSPTGLTSDAQVAVNVASAALAGAMIAAVRQGTLNQEAAEMLIAGGAGAYVATKAVLRANGLPC